MIRLLFVDDDAITRRFVTESIPWESLGVQLQYVAKDGYAAMQYFLSHPVDLVISDIRMPLFDGIEMAKEMRVINEHVKFIFLTGFPEFEYAKEALTLSALDFLTKPISTTRLMAIVRKAVSQIKKEANQQSLIEQSTPIVRRNDFITLLTAENGKTTIPFIQQGALATLLIVNLEFPADRQTTMLDLNTLCSRLEELEHCVVAAVRIAFQLVVLISDPLVQQETEFLSKTEVTLQQIEAEIQSSIDAEITFNKGDVIDSDEQIHLSFLRTLQGAQDSSYMLSKRVRQYLLEHLADKQLSLDSVADHFCINPCYLTVVFKKHYKQNVYNYLIKLRMERAAELLHTTELRIYEIAEAVGYKGSQYFTTSFRRFYGMTPTEYRKQSLEQ